MFLNRILLSGLKKPVKLSPELRAICGTEYESRIGVTQKLWKHIKEKNLQDPTNRQYILPDSFLSPVLGDKKIKMTEMPGKISQHVIKETTPKSTV